MITSDVDRRLSINPWRALAAKVGAGLAKSERAGV
jgi:hypothetical protein